MGALCTLELLRVQLGAYLIDELSLPLPQRKLLHSPLPARDTANFDATRNWVQTIAPIAPRQPGAVCMVSPVTPCVVVFGVVIECQLGELFLWQTYQSQPVCRAHVQLPPSTRPRATQRSHGGGACAHSCHPMTALHWIPPGVSPYLIILGVLEGHLLHVV